MKQSKFSLADLLTVLTAIAFGFVCFLSLNFYTLGDRYQSVMTAVIIAVLLGGTAITAKLLKRTNRNFKTFYKLEMAVLVMFTAVAIFFAHSPFPHYFNVSAKKAEIENNLKSSITQAEKMFAGYEQYAENRKNLYESKLRSAVAAKGINKEYFDYGFVSEGISDKKQIANKIFTIHADLFPTNYSDTTEHNGIKEVATNWLSKAKRTISSWKPIGIVDVVNDVEHNSKHWLDQLVALSSIREPGEEANDFSYKLSFNDVKSHFTKLGNPSMLSIGLALGIYLLMLLSWFVTKRSSKSFGSLKRAAYEVEL